MARMDQEEVRGRTAGGLLSFPVTHFDNELAFDEAPFREHVEWLSGFAPGALFAPGGTGEFFSLTLDEAEAVTKAAVEQVGGRLPVYGGAGYGTAMAKECVVRAERAGADGVLLLPPYLIKSESSGLAEHIIAVCEATSLPVIFYARDNARLNADDLERVCDRAPNLIGYKDGFGDVELLARLRQRLGDRLTFICGLPTAETYAAAYFAMGVATYTSAIFNFAPEFALRFFHAAKTGDDAFMAQATRDFLLPYVDIRNRGAGFAVSIAKAGLDVIGRPAGRNRPPLVGLDDGLKAELAKLIAAVGA